MAESFFAWLCVIVAFINFNPQWAIAAAIFAIAGQIALWRANNDR